VLRSPVATLPAVVICNNLESGNRASKHCVSSQYQYHPEVINIPEAAGIVSVVATADGTNVTVPEAIQENNHKI
jgi:hypothetical protein